MAIIIDRFEGDFAVVEVDGQAMKNIPKTDIPPKTREGDALKFVGGRYEIDPEETKRLKNEADQAMNDLW